MPSLLKAGLTLLADTLTSEIRLGIAEVNTFFHHLSWVLTVYLAAFMFFFIGAFSAFFMLFLLYAGESRWMMPALWTALSAGGLGVICVLIGKTKIRTPLSARRAALGLLGIATFSNGKGKKERSLH